MHNNDSSNSKIGLSIILYIAFAVLYIISSIGSSSVCGPTPTIIILLLLPIVSFVLVIVNFLAWLRDKHDKGSRNSTFIHLFVFLFALLIILSQIHKEQERSKDVIIDEVMVDTLSY